MDSRYQIEDPEQICSPALIIFQEVLAANLNRMLTLAGGATRLCPHCKTHKMAAIIRLELDLGIERHKCATIAEAEMLAETGVRDIFLAYNIVGPNIGRLVHFRQAYPAVELAVQVDDEPTLNALAASMARAGTVASVYVDLDVGQHRTGVIPGPAAHHLYQRLCRLPGVRPAGLHVYDGHNHQQDVAVREAAVQQLWESVAALRDELIAGGLPVPRIVAGGTGTFPLFARLDEPSMLLSPGTCVLHDAGYATFFADLGFQFAALLLTRVVSRPARDRITLDLGNKAVASDLPVERRILVPDLPDARILIHNEEHLVLETSLADQFRPGDVLLMVPGHICPTSALHQEAVVVTGGRVRERWPVSARDRRLSI